MSTTANPVASLATSSSPFGFKSVGHFFAVAFGDLKKATMFVSKTALPDAQKVLATAETVTAEVAPFIPQANAALMIERALDSAAGELLAAVHTAQPAEDAQFVDVKLDIATYQSFKSFIADQKSALSKLGYVL